MGHVHCAASEGTGGTRLIFPGEKTITALTAATGVWAIAVLTPHGRSRALIRPLIRGVL